MAKKRDNYKIDRKTIEVIDSPEIPSLRDAGGKRMSSRGVEVSDREMRGPIVTGKQIGRAHV